MIGKTLEKEFWSKVVLLKFNEYTGILFYNHCNGLAELRKIEPDLSTTLIKPFSNFRFTWHTILPIYYTKNSAEILFYDAEQGQAEFYLLDSTGNMILHQTHYKWRKTWKTISVLEYDDFNLLLFYDSHSGNGELYRIDAQFHFSFVKAIENWRTNWSSILALRYGGFNLVIFYCRETGEAEMYKVQTNGTFSQLKSYNNWWKSWDFLVPFSSNTSQSIIFYDNTNQEQELYELNADGNITLLHKYKKRKHPSNLFISICNNNQNVVILIENKTKLIIISQELIVSRYLTGQEFVIDGSNVARWHGQGNERPTPRLDIVLQIIKELKLRKANVKCFFDANTNLEFGKADKKIYDLLINKGIVHAVPGGSQADEFILSFAENNNGKIISNDRFRDRQNEYPNIVGSKDRLIKGKVIDGELSIPQIKIQARICVNVKTFVDEYNEQGYYL